VDLVAKKIFETQNVSLQEAYHMAREKIKQAEQMLRSIGGELPLIVPEDKGLRYQMTQEGKVEMVAAIEPGILPEEVYTAKDWLGVRAKYRTNPFKIFWEQFAHMSSFWHEKFIGALSPLEEYERYYYYGTYTMFWQQPLTYILAPSFLNTIANPLSIPFKALTLGVLGGTTPEASILIGMTS